jgi:hypothetical protein
MEFEKLPEPNAYDHLPSQHSSEPMTYEVSDPIFVNPSSHISVAIVLRKIGERAGIKSYGGGQRVAHRGV